MSKDLLPKPETDLPLPEKELESGEDNQTTVVNQNPPKEGRHLIRAFLFGFLFVVILAAIGGAYFLRVNKSVNNNQQTVTTQISTPSPTPDPTKDWQAYEGDGFTFKYPADWTAGSQDKYGDVRIAPPPDPSCPYCAGGVVGIDISTIENPNSLSLSEFLTTNGQKVGYDGPYKKDFSKLVLSNITDGMFNPTALGAGAINEEAIINNGNKIIVVYCGAVCDENNLFKNILSTFKFTDSASQSVDTSNWRNGSINNLSFKFPSSYSGDYVCGDKSEFFIDTNPIPTKCPYGDFTPGFEFKIIKNKTLDQAKKEFMADTYATNKTTKDITIDDHPALETKSIWPPGQDVKDHNDWTLYIFDKDNLYVFHSFDLHITSNEQKKYFDQIISTFKFTN